jgi:hypothetical protein
VDVGVVGVHGRGIILAVMGAGSGMATSSLPVRATGESVGVARGAQRVGEPLGT